MEGAGGGGTRGETGTTIDADTRRAPFLYLNTPPDSTLTWDELELSLIIRDNHNRSQLVRLPLTADMSAEQVIPAKWQESADRRITALMFDVESSAHYNRGGNEGNSVN